MQKRFKVFLDTSAIIAGLNSPTGAAGVLVSFCMTGNIEAIISTQVIEEAERNITKKFPRLLPAWQSFLLIPPTVTSNPTIRQIRIARKLIPTDDAPILASALKARPDAFVTWNTRDFMRPGLEKNLPFAVFTPGDFLKRFRAH